MTKTKLCSRSLPALLLSVLMIHNQAQAGTLTMTFSAQFPGSGLGTSEGSELPNDSLVRVGVFNADYATLQSNFNDQAALEGLFEEFARVYVGDFGVKFSFDEFNNSTLTNPGADFGIGAGFGVQVDFTDPTAFEDRQIYLWAVNSPTESGATETGLFADDAWAIPSGAGSSVAPTNLIIEFNTVDPLDVNDLYLGNRGPELALPPPDAGIGGELNKLLPLSPVPEPSVCLLLLVSFSLATFRRQRRPFDS